MGQGQGIGLNNLLVFYTTGTGNGSEQSIAHGMGRTPAFVIIQNTGADCTQFTGTHDSTNIKVTVENLKTYAVIAFFSRD